MTFIRDLEQDFGSHFNFARWRRYLRKHMRRVLASRRKSAGGSTSNEGSRR